jgi:GntR family transcriptional repressor for pyruvate dehydrogenase complex
MNSIWSPIKEQRHLTDRIADRIEQLIEDGRLKWNEQLPSEREMARLLGVSRPAVREAVKSLEARGLLVVRHGRGVFVNGDRGDAVRSRLAALEVNLEELFAMRGVLEGAAAAWAAASINPMKSAVLKRAFSAERAARNASPVDFARLAKLDAAFHLRVVEVAENRFLHQTLGVLQEMLASGMETSLALPERLKESGLDHKTILGAILAGDVDGARTAAVNHIHAARDAALARVRRESEALIDHSQTGPSN